MCRCLKQPDSAKCQQLHFLACRKVPTLPECLAAPERCKVNPELPECIGADIVVDVTVSDENSNKLGLVKVVMKLAGSVVTTGTTN